MDVSVQGVGFRVHGLGLSFYKGSLVYGALAKFH